MTHLAETIHDVPPKFATFGLFSLFFFRDLRFLFTQMNKWISERLQSGISKCVHSFFLPGEGFQFDPYFVFQIGRSATNYRLELVGSTFHTITVANEVYRLIGIPC